MDVRQGRWTAEIDGDFVVFIIGARAQLETPSLQGVRGSRRPPRHGPHAQVPDATPGEGTARLRDGRFTVIQYWRSFEHLEAFAKDTDDPHLEVWRNYWRRVGKGTRTGIWHETTSFRGRVRGDLQQHASARPRQGRQSSFPSPNLSALASESRSHALGASHSAPDQPSSASTWSASRPSRNSLTARLDLST